MIDYNDAIRNREYILKLRDNNMKMLASSIGNSLLCKSPINLINVCRLGPAA